MRKLFRDVMILAGMNLFRGGYLVICRIVEAFTDLVLHIHEGLALWIWTYPEQALTRGYNAAFGEDGWTQYEQRYKGSYRLLIGYLWSRLLDFFL